MESASSAFDDAVLAALEFPAVLQRIAPYATCEPGKNAVRSLRPLTDSTAVDSEQARHGLAELKKRIAACEDRLLILPVLSPAGRYSEPSEMRLRTRNAVLAGLAVLLWRPTGLFGRA